MVKTFSAVAPSTIANVLIEKMMMTWTELKILSDNFFLSLFSPLFPSSRSDFVHLKAARRSLLTPLKSLIILALQAYNNVHDAISPFAFASFGANLFTVEQNCAIN